MKVTIESGNDLHGKEFFGDTQEIAMSDAKAAVKEASITGNL